ncbi:MAG: sensor histidine kinase [Clostridium sp.]|uniref:sensor histidine kinase n=1 Tax=Clostridium sp. TaxID=1506 RepID=UPI003D6D7473
MKRKHNNRSFKNIIFLYTFSTTIMVLTIMYSIYYLNYKENIITQTDLVYKNYLSIISKELDNKLYDLEVVAGNISVDYDIVNKIKELQASTTDEDRAMQIAKMNAAISPKEYVNPNILNIRIIVDNNNLGKQMNKNSYCNINNMDNKEINQIYQNSSGWIKPRKIDFNMVSFDMFENKEQKIVSYFKKIYDSSNYDTIVGYVMIDIKLDYLERVIKNSNSSILGEATILDENDIVVFSNDKGNVIGSAISTDENTLKKLKFNNLIYSKQIERYNWKIIFIVHSDYIKSKLQRMNIRVLIIIFITVLLTILLSRVLSQMIFKPILELTNLMNNYKSNKTNLKKLTGVREIEFLYDSFQNMNEKVNKLLKDVENKEKRKRTIELNALQSQINPHFLYNTLDSVNWLALSNGNKDISAMVVKLSKLMRLSLNKGFEFYTFEEEIEHVMAYLDIQGYRYPNKFKVGLMIEGDVKNAIVPKLILQPIVENSLIHGFDEIEYMGKITIKAYNKQGVLVINIIDNGVGCKGSKLNDLTYVKNGYGLKNIEERIKLYFGKGYGITYMCDKSGVNVEITLPCRYNNFFVEGEDYGI